MSIVEKILSNLQTNKLANKIVLVLGNKCKTKMISFLYYYYRTHPTQKMKISTQFFQKHQDDICQNLSYLADSKSKEVYQKMIQFRCTYDLRQHPDYSIDDIYFVKDIVSLENGEVFCDAGAYNGNTTDKFITIQKKYNSIICIEPDKANYNILKDKYGNESNIILLNMGVWSHSGNLKFNAQSNMCSHVIFTDDLEKKSENIPVISIDELDGSEEITYIKMDIEGSEIQALYGACNTIKKNHPKLAVSIYHSDEDMIRIIRWIHELVPEYKMFIRQHSHSFMDTVLYCIY